MMDYWDGDHGYSVWSVVMTVGMLVFWVAVIVAIVWAVRTTRWPGPPDHGASRPVGDPESILAERLARGEIDVEEYRSRLDLLRTTSRR